RGERLVSGTPPLVPPRPASSPILHDAGPLRLLRRWRQHSAVTLVRQSGRADLAKVVVSARSTGLAPMGQLQRTPETPPAASRPDHSTVTPPRANLSREEPDAGNPHVRVCEGWGRRRPHLLGTRSCAVRRGALGRLPARRGRLGRRRTAAARRGRRRSAFP